MRKWIAVPLAALLLSSCALAPDYARPDVGVPSGWSRDSGAQTTANIAYDWWKSFGSDELDAVMDQALSNNTDLLAGVQKVAQARASLKIAGASLLPSIDASGGGSRSRSDAPGSKPGYATNLNAGLDVSYEVDLFGANRAGVSAAQADYEASRYDQDALALMVMGDVASGYFTLLDLRERLEIADQNLSNAKEVLRIIQARVDAGTDSSLELAQQKSAVASSEAARAALVQQIAAAENALAVLVGKPPQSIAVSAKNLSGISVPAIAPGQPSALLERRPDLKSAEASLMAADADIGAARAAFFPSLSLGGAASAATTGFGDPATTVLSLASSIAMPIFKGGQNEGGLEKATARQLELVQTYRGDVLNAFREVEDALALVTAAQDREAAFQTAMEQSREAYALSKDKYDAGAIDFQTLLDAQDSKLSAEDSYAQARLARLSAAIDLYKALGGGWKSQ